MSRAADSVTWWDRSGSGRASLSGRAIPHFDTGIREVCFEADAKSAASMPRWSGDTRKSWFCFTNQEEAQKSLAAVGETRAATIVIDRFTIQRGMSDQVNSAELVRVVSR